MLQVETKTEIMRCLKRYIAREVSRTCRALPARSRARREGAGRNPRTACCASARLYYIELVRRYR